MRTSYSRQQPVTSWFEGQSLFLLIGVGLSLSMLLPAAVATIQEQYLIARNFFYMALIGGAMAALITIARGARPVENTGRADLMALLALLSSYAFLPLFMAIPFWESLPATRFINAYAEMVSCFTTTGMSFYDDPRRLTAPLHLWRAQVGWMGGFMIWVAAGAIMAPLSIGGFEVTAAGRELGETRMDRFRRAGVIRRVVRGAVKLVPIYAGLTALLWLLLILAGDSPLVALIHAMSTISTSGISPIGGTQNAASGVPGEIVIAIFMLFALSRITFTSDTLSTRIGLNHDPELRMGALIVFGVTALLFVRHWIGAFDVKSGEQLTQALGALWGAFFTVLSFLTTTGWESSQWDTAQGWSGLSTPGMILMGLAMIGGGVATTAGGVKLLRLYTLYATGRQELERLVHPSSVSGTGIIGRRIRRQGAIHAWVFFMLFAMCLSGAMGLLALFHVNFESSTILSVAALSNTGPLTVYGGATPVSLSDLDPGARIVLCVTMILGRLELLALIALCNRDLWRD